MKNPIEEYLSTLLNQIVDLRARSDVEQEIRQHLEAQTDYYRKCGVPDKEAVMLAVKDMGDPVQTGVELNRIHRPKTAWRVVLIILLMSFFALGVKYIYYQSVLNSSCVWNNMFKDMVWSCIGILLMLGINYLDYSVIGKYAGEMMLFLLEAVMLGTLLFSEEFYGQRFILFCGIAFDIRYILLLTVPLYGGVLFAHRRGGWKSMLICMGWALLPGIVLTLLSGTVPASMILFGINMLTLIVVTSKNWFDISPGKGVTVLISCMAGMFTFFMGAVYLFGGYRRERILAWFAPEKYDVGYMLNYIRESILQSKWIGFNELSNQNIQRFVIVHRRGEYVLSCIASGYGIIFMLVVVALLILLPVWIYHSIWKQKNLLGKIMGTSCCLALLLQTIFYFMTNVGLLFGDYIGCPFLNQGGSCTLVDYIFLGILLSIFRYQYVLPADGPGRVVGNENVKEFIKRAFYAIKVEE